MKRFLLLSLTGINFLVLLFLSAAFASPGLRDIPQTGTNDRGNWCDIPDGNATVDGDSLGIDRANLSADNYYEYFNYSDWMDADNTTASWGSGRLTLPVSVPVVRNQVELGEAPTNVAVSDGYAYVTVAGGFLVYDIDDPDNVELLGSYQLHGSAPAPSQAVAIAVANGIAYVCAGNVGLEVVYVANPSNPVWVTTYRHPMSGAIHDAVIDGDYLYLVESIAGVVALDISNPLTPTYRGEATLAGMTDIDLYGDLIMTAGSDRIATFDAFVPGKPVLMDTHSLIGVRRIAVQGMMAYATVPKALCGIDVTTPTTIRQTSYSGLCDGRGLVFAPILGAHLYLADGSCGVRLVEVEDPMRMRTTARIDFATHPRELTLTDDFLIAVGDAPHSLVVMDRPRSPYSADSAVATSKTFYNYHRDITDVRIDAEQSGAIAWEVSVDAGEHWQSVAANGPWTKPLYPGGELRWRAFLAMEDGVVPRCTRLAIMMKVEPLPPRPGVVIRVRLDGTGDARNLHTARELAVSGDTLVLGDGVFTGPENRNLYFEHSLSIRSEHGPEHTTIDCEGTGYAFKFRGDDYNFHLNQVEGIQFRNTDPGAEEGAINADRCFLTVVDCVFRNCTNPGIFTGLAFVNVRDSKFIDCDDGIAAQFSLDVSDCLFQGLGFAVWFHDGGVRVRGSTFFDNRTAIYIGGDGGATIEGNTMSHNGLGVGMSWASGTIRDNVIDSNGTGIWLAESHALPIEGNLIARNTDAAMSIEGSDADIVGNTISDNGVRRDALIDIRDFSDVTVSRNLIAFNLDGDIFGNFENTHVLVTQNNFFENYGDPLVGTIDGGGNQFADPWFCDRADGRYTVSRYSPCLPDNNPAHIQIGARGVGCSTKDDSIAETPIRPGLISVAPNPFNPTTRIRYGLTEPGEAQLTIYDVAGRVVERLIRDQKEVGEWEIEWNADAVSSGVYFARLTTPEGAYTHKLVVVK